MAEKSPKPIKKIFTNFISRFHLTLFFVFVVGCLIGSVILINRMVTEGQTNSQGYTSSIQAGNIDNETLERLRELRQSAERPPEFVFPEGRINPVGE